MARRRGLRWAHVVMLLVIASGHCHANSLIARDPTAPAPDFSPQWIASLNALAVDRPHAVLALLHLATSGVTLRSGMPYLDHLISTQTSRHSANAEIERRSALLGAALSRNPHAGSRWYLEASRPDRALLAGDVA